MTAPAITASALSKRYRLGTSRLPYGRLTESITAGVGHLVRRRRREGTSMGPEHVWALRDVSFDIEHGEVVGVVGSNGAGKTTLLKILSRITEPTSGQATVTGRVGALLEVAAGFHHELTGRENVFLNGAILGMPRSEIQRRFDEIVSFSEVEDFLDTPVKRYSSGMFLRLAFAVAAHLEPDVLIVDEVLAVGDAAFQKKCLGRMGDVARSGRTVLFVSHNMGAVRSLCQRAMVLDKGQVVFDGSAQDAVGHYLSKVAELGGGGEIAWDAHDPTAPASPDVALEAVRVVAPTGKAQALHQTDEPVRIQIEYGILRSVRGMRIVVAILTQEGEIAFKTTDHKRRPEVDLPGRYRSTAIIPHRFLNRRNYVVRVSFEVPGVRWLLRPLDLMTFTVSGPGSHGSDFPEAWDGAVSPEIEWTLEPLPQEQRTGLVQDPLPRADTQTPMGERSLSRHAPDSRE